MSADVARPGAVPDGGVGVGARADGVSAPGIAVTVVDARQASHRVGRGRAEGGSKLVPPRRSGGVDGSRRRRPSR